MLDVTQVFNQNDILGQWINSITQNFTGSLALTLVFGLIILLILIAIFKMPDMFIIILLFAPLVLFSRIDQSFNMMIGIAIIFFAFVIWSLFPAK